MDEKLENSQVSLREKQSELIRVIEGFEKLKTSKEWETLNELIFSKSLKAIERQLLNETLAPEISIEKLYKLQGEWVWAKQYTELDRFMETLKRQLEEIKKRLK